MLMPKRVKYRKQQRGRMRGKALRGAELTFGEYGLQALEPGWVTARQIEAARRALVRVMKRRGKLWIRIFPDHPYTQKPPETRMGKGKGNVEYWVAVVRPGRIMFEVGGLPDAVSVEALEQAAYKFSIQTKVIARHEIAGEPEWI
ncbi:MAG: 50S ribosomal protein L16 [Anaerolineaceae bacterium]|jgi:large subunit ribosomal protein L16